LLSDLGIWYDQEENDDEVLNAEIFAKDSGSRYGANYYGVAGIFETEAEDEE
jgi:hypothetical protein